MLGFSRVVTVTIIGLLLAVIAQPAGAGLFAVSGKQDVSGLTSVPANGDLADVAVSLANGFPIWYQDAEDGFKYALCLDSELEVAPGILINPCELDFPFIGAPPSFPNNFGSEAMYWAANVAGTYTSSNGVNSFALLTLAQEAG
jgi:hypothetical protein